MIMEYDFSKGKRGPVIRTTPGKTRITIRIDDEILEWFRDQVHAAGFGNCQTLINTALREYISAQGGSLEEPLRRVIREEACQEGCESVKGKRMRKGGGSVSKADSYRDIGEYWGLHDLSEVWSKTKKVKFQVRIESEAMHPSRSLCPNGVRRPERCKPGGSYR